MKEKLQEILQKHVPTQAVNYCIGLWEETKFSFTVTNKRSSCFGNHSFKIGRGHLITVNNDLAPHAFLLTYVHEVAHLRAFEKYERGNLFKRRRSIEPHGQEWKDFFKFLMQPILSEAYFPEPIFTPLRVYMSDPKASSVSFQPLAKVLHFEHDGEGLHLSDVKVGEVFQFRDSLYRKIETRRTRVLSENVETQKRFLISAAAHVTLHTGEVVPAPKRLILNDLLVGAKFNFMNEGYIKIERRRTRVLVEKITDKKRYLISGDAPITPF